MTKRGLYATAGASLGVVAFVAVMALLEHLARLATSPALLSLVATGALICAWFLLRAGRAS